MDVELTGRSALDTGGAGGLGAATVRHLVGLGLHVAIFDRNAEGADTLAADVGKDTVAVGGDVNNDDDVSTAITAARAMGPIALLVNIAGGGVRSQRTVSKDGTPHDKEAFAYTMAINAAGTFNVSRLVAAAMAANEPDDDGQRGVIVNTSSLAGLEGQAGQLAYAAAKAAIAGMTLPMARDLAPLGIRVCTIAPGTMATPVFQNAPEALKERLVGDVVFPKRMGRPEEFALAVEMILRNSYLNGEVIRLDAALRFPPK
jgi:NAD(P)-dependent dehydrogenase (short-subunit alcohol dehydrogenase family)